MRRTPLKRVSPNRDVAADGAWSQRVLTRDRFVCVVAATVPEVACSGRIDPHHIAPKGKYPELRHDPTNGVSCCRRHHDWIHNEQPRRARELGLLR